MHQYEHHQKHGRPGTPVIFKPPLEQLKPDFLLSIDEAVALVDSQYKKHKNAFVFSRKNIFSEVFLADNESELHDWLAKLNHAATFRTAGVRMRTVVGKSPESSRNNGSQRDVSGTSAASEHSADPEVALQDPRDDEDFSSQIMVARRQIINQKIKEANDNLISIERQLDNLLRSARQLKILAPIQEKTRDDVITAAMRLATHTRLMRMEKWMTKCHRDILELDLEEDFRAQSQDAYPSDGLKKDISPQTTKESKESRSPFGRLNSKGALSQGIPKLRPTSQKLFSMDEIFRAPSRLRGSHHRPKGSWELPPLSFDRNGSTVGGPALTNESKYSDEQAPAESENESASTSVGYRLAVEKVPSEVNDTSANSNLENPEQQETEREMLAEAGAVTVDPEAVEEGTPREEESEDDRKLKPAEPTEDGKEALQKVRHSIHKKLQPGHHRSKKGRESGSSAGGAEENGSMTDSEGLPRNTNNFTVNGKKASIITFGSAWQTLSPEERLKSRRPQSGMSRMETSSSFGATDGDVFNEMRPSTSAASSSVITAERTASQSTLGGSALSHKSNLPSGSAHNAGIEDGGGIATETISGKAKAVDS